MEIKLRQIREKKGISQETMAEHLNISQSQYYRKERGTSKIQEREWDIIANVLDIDKSEIKDESNILTISREEILISSSPLFLLSEQLTAELQEHIRTLKQKIIFIKDQYESRLKDKEELILLLKQNKKD
ncbi:helix-turn-helix domain-containing protein [Flavobacterium aquidurense]|uniref:helix-turn-helix domain-containing protein n=1 Tax=Flavobacterium aquidurense TaxID=362413 RepID=UPI003723754A